MQTRIKGGESDKMWEEVKLRVEQHKLREAAIEKRRKAREEKECKQDANIDTEKKEEKPKQQRREIVKVETGQCLKTSPCKHDAKVIYKDGTCKSTFWRHGDATERKYYPYTDSYYKEGHGVVQSDTSSTKSLKK